MDIVDQLKAFVATAQTGSFTSAADQLGLSNRLTSKYVAELEARLGTRLFQRTTRRVGLTPSGEDLLARAPAVLDDLDALLAEATEEARCFSGVIRISAPMSFGELRVAPMLGRFAEANPGLTLDLRLSDQFVDLAREGIDLAFRIGTLDMASLKTRKLGEYRAVTVASPAYLASAGIPERPEALSGHACIIDTNRRHPRRWTYGEGDQAVPVTVSGRFQVNSARAAVGLAAAGLGVACVPGFALGDSIKTGTLVPLLTEFAGETGPISAVYLEGRSLPRKVRALIDFAGTDLRGSGDL